MHIAYVSAILDLSGYAESSRNNIAALLQAGVKVDAIPVSFENFKKGDMGILGNLIKDHVTYTSDAKIRIVHTVPFSYKEYALKNCYNIGYTTWEADRLPPEWVPQINIMNEVWVPCKQNVEAFRRSGVTIPIYVIPHAFNNDLNFKLEPDENNFATIAQLGDSFVFYSIFQWLERKNPVGTLKTYLSEFNDKENVSMIVKTYISNPEDITETNKLRLFIAEVKKLLRLNNYPKLYLVTNILSRAQMALLHQRGDCYVHLARAEGFGQPITEAMLAKNPVIVCGYGGPEDFVRHNIDGFLVDYQMTPVYGMPWNTYTAKMSWAEPDLMQTRKYMRELFENREKAKLMGQEGYKNISTNNSWQNIGNLMVNRLQEIQAKLES